MTKRIFCVLLAAAMLLCMVPLGFAAEDSMEVKRIVPLTSPEDLLRLAENCRLDSYSMGTKVVLKKDIDMTGVDFTPIPIFCGLFEGNGHTISGIRLNEEGSYQGLFRYLGEDAVVRGLRLEASVEPKGSRRNVGGIAGENAGKIVGCSFRGTVSGADVIGGIVGSNTLTGIVEDCSVSGTLSGSHMVGGIAGENLGVIRRCANHADVNTTAKQNQISLSDISLSTLTDSENVSTVTDVGGVAGSNTGVIANCTNQGDVGYQKMACNVGGIAGRQNGTIMDCRNHGAVSGRKEVGGIVGHLEPATKIEYSEDAMQILEKQLDALRKTVSYASSNVQDTAAELTGQVMAMSSYVDDARKAAQLLVPDSENPQLPDEDAITAARNGLSSSFSNLSNAIHGLANSTYSNMGALSGNMTSIQNQLSAMGETLGSAAENLGGKVEDVSDEDTEGDLSGKVGDCVNYGPVQADLNLGGIAGAIALQSELDAVESLEFVGERSMNLVNKVRAVIRNCHNQGEVTGGKQNMGGIAGYQTIGLIRQSRNTASVGEENAQYVGGIVGNSTGYVRENSAKCHLEGASCVGGIAGLADVATDCRAMVEITGGKEKLGAVLGEAGDNLKEVEDPICNNLYTYHGTDPGGIDSISYAGRAEGRVQEDFLKLEDTPELFQEVTVTFRFADGQKKVFTVKPSQGLEETQIPEVPAVAGFEGFWDGMEDADLSHIDFDLIFDAVYESDTLVIASAQVRNALPVLLAQGNFTQLAAVELTALEDCPAAPENSVFAEGWKLTFTGIKAVTMGRFLLPEMEGGDPLLLVQLSDGSWQPRSFETNGSYITFCLDGSETALALYARRSAAWQSYALAGGGIAVLALALLLVKKKKK